MPRMDERGRSGWGLFLAGTLLFAGAAGSGFYRLERSPGAEPRWQANNLIPPDPRWPVVDRRDFHKKPSEIPGLLLNSSLVLALGLGAPLAMIGLRELTRPDRRDLG